MFHQKLFVRRMWAVAWKNWTAGADLKVVCYGAIIARMKSVGDPPAGSQSGTRGLGPRLLCDGPSALKATVTGNHSNQRDD